MDVDIALGEESEDVLRAIPALKEGLEINVELASPGDFIPELPGWQERSPFISRIRKLDFYHYDLYAQALSKIERGHELDVTDVQEMLARGLVDPDMLLELFARIEQPCPWRSWRLSCCFVFEHRSHLSFRKRSGPWGGSL